MEKAKFLRIAAILLFILGVIMIYLGGVHAAEVILPPIVTGLGFFIIAWVLIVLKKN